MIPAPRPRSRAEMIGILVAKDLRASWTHLVVVVFAAAVVLFFTVAMTSGFNSCFWRWEPFVWNWSSVASMYAVAALVTGACVGLAFADFYGGEIRKGTVRALILYPIDMTDLTVAKLLSATVVGSATSAIGYFVPLAPLAMNCTVEGRGVAVIFFGALAATLFIVWTGAFLSLGIAHATGRLWVTPPTLAGLLLVGAVLTTQHAIDTAGVIFLNVSGRGYDWPTAQAIWNVAGAVSVVSPHHAIATVLSGLLGPFPHFPDVYVAFPLGIAAIAYGVYVGGRIPLDVYIR